MIFFFFVFIFSCQSFDECVSNQNELILKERRKAIEGAFIHSYNSYERNCFGRDEIRPVTGDCRTTFGDIGVTIFDCLDMLIILGLDDEFDRAKEFVSNFDFSKINEYVSFFEIVIRVVGGLLSAFDLSQEQIFLTKAIELSDSLLSFGFDANSGFPYSLVNLRHKRGRFKAQQILLSEISSFSVEWLYLSHHSGDDRYKKKVEEVIFDLLVPLELPTPNRGLFNNVISLSQYQKSRNNNETTTHPSGGSIHVSLGGKGDSAYEYFLKAYLLTNDERYLNVFKKSLEGIRNRLWKIHPLSQHSFVVEIVNEKESFKMDHLACFFSGSLSLYHHHVHEYIPQNREKEEQNWVEYFARELGDSCMEFYRGTSSGLGPEIVYFKSENASPFFASRKGWDSHYFLRPETVESVFYLYRATKDEKYLEFGWNVFQNIEKVCKTDFAFSGIRNVFNETGEEQNNVMESFFLTETLKYLFLLFSDSSVIPLEQYVFNTEAHPLKKIFT